MTFRTIVNIKPSKQPIDHSHTLVFIGSCFAENIGAKFRQARFRTDINPFGVLYNPFSIASALRRLMSATPYEEKDLFFDNGMWHSASHHSSFSDKDKAVCLQKINSRLSDASQNLRKAKYLFITFGTAWVYEWADGSGIAGNCHKLPAKKFTRRRLSVNAIEEEYKLLNAELLAFNPDLNIVFTVSPIRHWKDGAHENQLSKSTLLLAIDGLVSWSRVLRETQQPTLPPSRSLRWSVSPSNLLSKGTLHYFPAYEIVNDDLRDYRFYTSDMIHLSDVAVDYVWERVCETFFSPATRTLIDEATQINKARQHRPFNPESEEYQNFLQAIEAKEKELLKTLHLRNSQNYG